MYIGLIDTGDKSFSRMPHLGLACLASYLREHGHQIKILDLYFSDTPTQSEFFQDSFDLIGLTSTSYSFITCLTTIKQIRQVNRKVKIVLGGPHVSVARREVLQTPEIDFAIYGEGEKPLLALAELFKRVKTPTQEDLATVPALIYRHNEQIITNPPPARIKHLDNLPFPSYSGFPLHKYSCYPLSTSRGCPYNCIYCAAAAVIGTQWFHRSPESLIAEIKSTIKRYGMRDFYVIDDSFNLNEQRVTNFCKLLLNEQINITWGTCGFRADKTDPGMLSLMKDSGCTGVCVGIESADPKVLKNIGKGETVDQIRTGIQRIHEAGLHITGMFMIGNPGDTLKSVQESFVFARSLPLDTIRFYLAIPYPETNLWKFANKHGRLLERDYKNFHDFSDKPVFETDDFTAQEREIAYREALTIMFPEKIPDYIEETSNTESSAPNVSDSKITTRYAPQ